MKHIKLCNRKLLNDTGFTKVPEDGRWKVATAKTSLNECSCKFHQTMKLPCKHIFAFCETSHQPLFEERLAHNRWRLDN